MIKYEDVYRKLILEAQRETAGEASQEVKDDYDAIIEACLEAERLQEDKKKAIADLLHGFKQEKFKIEAIKMKMDDLRNNMDFLEEVAPIITEFSELGLDFGQYSKIQDGFNKMIENPNYDNRRNFCRRVINWLKKEDAKTVVALAKVDAKLRKVFKKYCQADVQ